MVDNNGDDRQLLLKNLTSLFLPTASELQSVPLLRDLTSARRPVDTSFKDIPYIVSSPDPKLNGTVSWIRKIQLPSEVEENESLTSTVCYLSTVSEESYNSTIPASSPEVDTMPQRTRKRITSLNQKTTDKATKVTKNSKTESKKRIYEEIIEDEVSNDEDFDGSGCDSDVTTNNVEIISPVRSRRKDVSEDGLPKRARTRQSKRKFSRDDTSPSGLNLSNNDVKLVGSRTITNLAKEENSNPVRSITLRTWSLKSGSKNRILVAGYREGEESTVGLWCSSLITERISNTKLRSSAGTIYILKGQIQIEVTVAQGISRKIAVLFKKGFPPNWKSILSDNVTKTAAVESSDLVTKKQVKKIDHNNSFSFLSHNTHTNLCEASVSKIGVEELPRTRSGRRIIPRLAFWKNQYIKVDTHQNISIVNGISPNVELPNKKNQKVKNKSSDKKQEKVAKQTRKVQKDLKISQSLSNGRKTEKSTQSRSHSMTLRNRKGPTASPVVSDSRRMIKTQAVIKQTRAEITENSSSSKTRRISRSLFQSVSGMTDVSTNRIGSVTRKSSRGKAQSVVDGLKKIISTSKKVMNNKTEQGCKLSGGVRNVSKAKSNKTKSPIPLKRTTRTNPKKPTKEKISDKKVEDVVTPQRKKTNKTSKIQTPKIEKEKQPVPELTARPGTLARKRQIRDIMQYQSQNYEADLFTAAAYKIPECNIPGIDDNDAYDLKSNSSTTSTCKTPVSKIPPLQPASRHRTPEPDFEFSFEPEINRKEVDTYIHNRRKKGQGPQLQKRLRGKGESKTRRFSSKASFHRLNKKISSLLVSGKTARENYEDDEEEDYYFD